MASNHNTKKPRALTRREALQLAAGGAMGLVLYSPLLSFATQTQKALLRKKLVWVVLRGALDSLHAVPPLFDPDLRGHRASLVDAIEKKARPLARGFALHPSLSFCHKAWQDKQFLPIVAVATDYRERSHFDAQDVLESGRIQGREGWLGRALDQRAAEAISITQTLPLSLRGSNQARTYYPSNFREPSGDFYDRLRLMYRQDKALSAYLEKGLETRGMLNDPMRGRVGNFVTLASRAGELLTGDGASDCAMLEMGGWDTHNAQIGRLDRQLKQLDQGLEALKTKLGQAWQNTVVIVATEFGRTVRVNGTAGTDHGTASSLWLLGGAVKGGRVLGEWPGLAPDKLFENRDLAPTSRTDDWLASVLTQHWQLDAKQLNRVFGSARMSEEQLIV